MRGNTPRGQPRVLVLHEFEVDERERAIEGDTAAEALDVDLADAPLRDLEIAVGERPFARAAECRRRRQYAIGLDLLISQHEHVTDVDAVGPDAQGRLGIGREADGALQIEALRATGQVQFADRGLPWRDRDPRHGAGRQPPLHALARDLRLFEREPLPAVLEPQRPARGECTQGVRAGGVEAHEVGGIPDGAGNRRQHLSRHLDLLPVDGRLHVDALRIEIGHADGVLRRDRAGRHGVAVGHLVAGHRPGDEEVRTGAGDPAFGGGRSGDRKISDLGRVHQRVGLDAIPEIGHIVGAKADGAIAGQREAIAAAVESSHREQAAGECEVGADGGEGHIEQRRRVERHRSLDAYRVERDGADVGESDADIDVATQHPGRRGGFRDRLQLEVLRPAFRGHVEAVTVERRGEAHLRHVALVHAGVGERTARLDAHALAPALFSRDIEGPVDHAGQPRIGHRGDFQAPTESLQVQSSHRPGCAEGEAARRALEGAYCPIHERRAFDGRGVEHGVGLHR